MAITYTQDDLDALKEILLTGAGSVQIGDKKIEYRSQSQILALIKMVQENLEDSSSDDPTGTIQATYSKGRVE
jgi:hypothetical protein